MALAEVMAETSGLATRAATVTHEPRRRVLPTPGAAQSKRSTHMLSPTIAHRTTRRLSGLTPKGHATVALIAIRDGWEQLTPSQRQEATELLERLAVALRREHSVVDRAPSAVRVPLLARVCV